MYSIDDTIAAVASAGGGALRGILRLSGPDLASCLARCFRAADGQDPSLLCRATVVPGYLRLPPPCGALECDLYYWPGRRSYTRQPSAELHTIGSPPLLEAALQSVCEAGARIARPGEFTLRAFLAGRLDLTQAEAVLGVIDARDRSELQVALAQLAGGLATPLTALRHGLLELLTDIEAGLDFVEEDIGFISRDEMSRQLADAERRIRQLQKRLSTRSYGDASPRVVLVGSPNVGKSSLLNALAGEPSAIVCHIAGTTRDYVTRAVRIEGSEVQLIDTAGVSAAGDPGDEVSRAAQQMTAGQSAHADLQLLCIDSTRPFNDWESEQINSRSAVPRLVVLTKIDAGPWPGRSPIGIPTSARSGTGLSELRKAIRAAIDACSDREHLMVAATAARCREGLQLARCCLQRAREVLREGMGEELIAAEVRLALDELGKIVGAVYTEDILDRIFSRFCIGK